MGFDRESWRIDDAVHPFATGFGSGDVRITTRWDETYFASALYGAMHECGHGLYEAGIADSLQRTPLGHAESLSLHESQSRMWENMVGRGRPFSGVLAPLVGELRSAPSDRTPTRCTARSTGSSPSFIRVEADEATYGLHVVLRFELEQELIEGRLAVADLPEAWNARFKEYLGLDVPDDAHGVLQDVHWSAGLIGYFPTYALGNLIAGQLWERVHADIPDLDDQIAAGELGSAARVAARARPPARLEVLHDASCSSAWSAGRSRSGPFVGYLKAQARRRLRRRAVDATAYSDSSASLSVPLGRIAAVSALGVGPVVAADVDRRALHLGQLLDDPLLVRGQPLGQRREALGQLGVVGLRRPAPAPSTAPGRSGCRGCRARRSCATASGSPPARRPIARSSVSARTCARGLSSLSASSSSDGPEGQELAQRVPAQVVLPQELLDVLGRRAAGAGLEQPAAVHQRDDRLHLGARAELEDREQVGQVVAQHVAGDRDRVLAPRARARA